jgi:predicted esterase
MLPRTIVAACLLALCTAAPASARPGPDLLYAGAAVAPQLTNSGIWKAPPILVSGTTAYRRGEFLYQDYLYDDHGAQEIPDPSDPRTGGDLFSRPNGTYTYPTDPRYAGNAADIVEFRLKPLADATAFRLTLNTLKDPSLVAFTIALGDLSSPSRPLPFGADVSAPADVVVTVHPKPGGGLTSSILTTGSSRFADGTAPVSVDPERRQIEVRLPHDVWNPRRGTRRVALGVGLWDAANGRYLLPQLAADSTHPGGGGAGGAAPAFFNVAFRTGEEVPSPTEGTAVVTSPAWWRDRQQGVDLAKGDISHFSIHVDFAKLARRVTDNRDVPRTGAMDRILPSHFELHQGTDFSQQCLAAAANCPGQYQGRLQPYAIYIPHRRRPAPGYGMTLLMHSLSANYNQYLGTHNQSQFGERGDGSIVITPEARGPDEDYQNYGAADVFDVWNDVARRYTLDPSRSVATGYSMGGVGSFVLGEQFPDLFARIQPTVGFETNPGLEASLRNVPVLMWNNHGDELANEALFHATAAELDTLGYRYTLDAFQPCANAACSPLFPNHLQLAVNDQFAPAAAFLDDAAVDSNPAHVTYVLDTARNHKELGLVGDHAYWVSGLTARDPSTSGAGTDPGGQIDVVSHGDGAVDPASTSLPPGIGTLGGGNLGPLVYTQLGQTWTALPPGPASDALTVTATNIATATIDPKRAGVTCAARVDITSDGPITVTLAGCNRTVTGG